MPRARHIAAALRAHLPSDYPQATGILIRRGVPWLFGPALGLPQRELCGLRVPMVEYHAEFVLDLPFHRAHLAQEGGELTTLADSPVFGLAVE